MAADRSHIFLLDKLNRRRQVLNHKGNYRYSFGDGQLQQPISLTLDRCGNLYVADQFYNSVHIFQVNDGKMTSGGRFEIPNSHLLTDIWIDDNLLYLSDGPVGRVRVFLAPGAC